MSGRNSMEREDTRFAGYGDRVGSGVEAAPTRWRGGELVTDPSLVTKSLKPRRLFYSPIGDGVVAADGVEMKRAPPDLTPRVSVIQQRVVERGPPGQAGVKVVEKTWTSGGGGTESGHTNEHGALGGGGNDLGRKPAAANNLQSPYGGPFGALSDPLGLGNNAGQPNAGGFGGPAQGFGGPTQGYGGQASPAKPAASALADLANDRQPYAGSVSSLGSSRPNPYENRIKSPQNGLGDSGNYGQGPHHDYPASGRSSASMFSEPGMRYEIKKDYMVTNPRELIHQYATTTPITSISGYESLPGGGTTTQTIKQSYSSTVEESYGPFPPYKAGGGGTAVNPNKFVRQLRDDTMTTNQRQANLNTQALNPKDSAYEQRIDQIRRQTSNQSSPNPEIQSLTNRLLTGLQTGHPTPPRL